MPVTARLLATGKPLELHRRDIGYDLDSAIHYDVLIPADFTTGRAFVIELALGRPTAQNADRADAFM